MVRRRAAPLLLALALLVAIAYAISSCSGLAYTEFVEVVFSVDPPGGGELAWAVYRDKQDRWPPEYPVSSTLKYWNQWYEVGSFMYVEARPHGCYELYELKVAPEYVVLSRPAPNKVEIGIMSLNGSISVYARFAKIPAAQCPYVWLPWAPAYRIEKGALAAIASAIASACGAGVAAAIWRGRIRKKRLAEDMLVAEARRFAGALKKLYHPLSHDRVGADYLMLRLMAEEPVDLKHACRSAWQMEVLARCGDVEFLRGEVVKEIYSEQNPVKKFELLERSIPEVANLMKVLMALRDMAPAHAKIWLAAKRGITGSASPRAAINAILAAIRDNVDLQNEAKNAFNSVIGKHPEIWRLIHSTPPLIVHVMESVLSRAIKEEAVKRAEPGERPAVYEPLEAASEQLNKQLVILAKKTGLPPRILLDEAARNLFPNPLRLDEELSRAAEQIASARGADPELVKDALKNMIVELRRAVLEGGMSVLEGLPVPSDFLRLKPEVVSLYSLGCNPFKIVEAAKRIMWSPSPEAAYMEVDSTIYDGVEVDEVAKRRVAQAILEAAQTLSSGARAEVERAAKEVAEAALAGKGSVSALAGEAAKRLSRDAWPALAEEIASRARRILAEARKPLEVVEVGVRLKKCPSCGLELEAAEGGAACKECGRVYIYKVPKPATMELEEVEVAVIGPVCPFCGSELEAARRAEPSRLCRKCRRIYRLKVEGVAWYLTIDAAEVKEGVIKVIELENYNYFIPSGLEIKVIGGKAHVYEKLRFRGRGDQLDAMIQALIKDQSSDMISVITLTEGGWYGREDFHVRRLCDLLTEVMSNTGMRARIAVIASGQTPFYNIAKKLYEALSEAGLQCEYAVMRIDEEGVVRMLQSLNIDPDLFKELFKAFPRLVAHIKAGASIAEAVLRETEDVKGYQFVVRAVEMVCALKRRLTLKEVGEITGDPYGGRGWFRVEVLRSLGLVKRWG
ncbi:MAG: hypothetical protein QXL31_05910 [Thermosphaera sp.]